MKNLFILGNPRSGTTLLRLMLNCHSKITVPPECGFIQWWYSRYKNWSKKDSSNKEQVRTFLKEIRTSKKIEIWDLNYFELEERILKQLPLNYKDLSNQVILQFASQQGKKPTILGDKNNYYINHLQFLGELYKDDVFIGIVRDGRDVACSYLEVNQLKTNSAYKPSLTSDIAEIALEWKNNNTNILKFIQNSKLENRIIIRFEDLVNDSVSTLNSLCEVIDIKFEPRMINYYSESQTGKEPIATLDWKEKTKEPPDKSRIGRFKDELGKEHIAKFNIIAGDMLVYFGYRLS